MPVQAPTAVIMIRPHRFTPEPRDGGRQRVPDGRRTRPRAEIASDAHDEVTRAAAALEAAGVTVHLFDDEDAHRPDSVFPNNWLSTHAGGHVALYPMYAPNRRTERRADIVEALKARYRVQDVIDYSGLEYDDVFLEGTGAMVLDHESRVAYIARSHRADPVMLERFCTNFGYEPMVFDATDSTGLPIYHTNVLMCIATDFALVGLSMIDDPVRRQQVADRIAGRGHRTVVELTAEQIGEFAGNAIELEAATGACCSPCRAGRGVAHRRAARRSSSAVASWCPSTCRRSNSPADRCAACSPASTSTRGRQRHRVMTDSRQHSPALGTEDSGCD